MYKIKLFVVCFLLAFVYKVPEVSPQTETSDDIPYSDIEKLTGSMVDKYRNLQENLQKTFEYSNIPLKHTAISVSLKKKQDIKFNIVALELFLDKKLVASEFYSEGENSFLEIGGRQKLYERDLPEGKHELSVNVFGHTPATEKIVMKKKRKVTINKYETLFLEVLIHRSDNNLKILVNQLGVKKAKNLPSGE